MTDTSSWHLAGLPTEILGPMGCSMVNPMAHTKVMNRGTYWMPQGASHGVHRDSHGASHDMHRAPLEMHQAPNMGLAMGRPIELETYCHILRNFS